MIEKICTTVLLAALLLALPGCTLPAQTQTESAYQIYFMADGSFGTAALKSESRELPEGMEPIDGLLTCLLKGPVSTDLTSALPDYTTLRGWTLRDGVVTVDFSDQYGNLSGIDLTLADYSVTLTLTQLDEVDAVIITSEGKELPYRDHQTLLADEALFAVFRSEPVQRRVQLYYPLADSSGLGLEIRQLEVTDDLPLPAAALQALQQGPEREDAAALSLAGEILSTETRDGECIVNVSAEFAQQATGDEGTDRLDLYALVNTLCGLDGVNAVRLLREGEPLTEFGKITLTEPLAADLSYVVY